MARPITWRNVSGNFGDPSRATALGAKLLTEGLGGFSNLITDIDERDTAERSRNLLATIQGETGSVDEFNALRDAGDLTRAALRERAGGRITDEAFNQITGRGDLLQQRFLADDAYQQRTREIGERPLLENFASELAGVRQSGNVNDLNRVDALLGSDEFANISNRPELVAQRDALMQELYNPKNRASLDNTVLQLQRDLRDPTKNINPITAIESLMQQYEQANTFNGINTLQDPERANARQRLQTVIDGWTNLTDWERGEIANVEAQVNSYLGKQQAGIERKEAQLAAKYGDTFSPAGVPTDQTTANIKNVMDTSIEKEAALAEAIGGSYDRPEFNKLIDKFSKEFPGLPRQLIRSVGLTTTEFETLLDNDVDEELWKTSLGVYAEQYKNAQTGYLNDYADVLAEKQALAAQKSSMETYLLRTSHDKIKSDPRGYRKHIEDVLNQQDDAYQMTYLGARKKARASLGLAPDQQDKDADNTIADIQRRQQQARQNSNTTQTSSNQNNTSSNPYRLTTAADQISAAPYDPVVKQAKKITSKSLQSGNASDLTSVMASAKGAFNSYRNGRMTKNAYQHIIQKITNNIGDSDVKDRMKGFMDAAELRSDAAFQLQADVPDIAIIDLLGQIASLQSAE